MKDPTYAPMYCALYPKLTAIARHHGYALAVHGTLARDMDLICIPWIEHPSPPQTVVDEITREFHIREVGEPDTTVHGRERFTITVGFGECFIDLSFMPRIEGRPDYEAAFQRDITNLVMRHVDRMNDVCDEDTAQDIIKSFTGKFNPLFDAYMAAKFPGREQQPRQPE